VKKNKAKFINFVGYYWEFYLLNIFGVWTVFGAALNGIGDVVPHILSPLAQIWNFVTTTTKSTLQWNLYLKSIFVLLSLRHV